MYGDNEELLAKWFKQTGKRDKIFLASKFGYVRGSQTLKIDSSPEYCKKACELTLRTLGVDYLDLCKFRSNKEYFFYHHNEVMKLTKICIRLCTQR